MNVTQVELARRHGISDVTLCRRMKADAAKDPTLWVKDLRKEVQRAAQALLAQEQVQQTIKAGKEAGSVLAAAEAVKQVIAGHREDVRRARGVADDLLRELAGLKGSQGDLAKAIEIATEGDEAAAKALQTQLRELMRIHNRVGSAQKLADTMLKLQSIERKAFSIPDEGPEGDDLDQLSDAELDARIEAELAKRDSGL